MKYIIKYRDERTSLVHFNRNDKKLKKKILTDVHTVTVVHLEQKFKPTYRVIVNQSIGGNNEIYPVDICHEFACS